MLALMLRRKLLPLFAVGLACAALAGCAARGSVAADSPATLTVFAAASLTGAFSEIGQEFTADTGIPVAFNFAGSQQLRAQLEQGADADVFASANTREMTAAIASRLVVTGTERLFAGNRLVVIYPKSNPAGMAQLADLAKPGLKLVVADKAVPVGEYSLDLLEKMSRDPGFGADFEDRVLRNVVSYEQNVKAVVSKVQLGEADAGIAYATDVTPEAGEKVAALPVPDAFNQVATYSIAALARSRHAEQAAEFVSFVLSDRGQAILAERGFTPAQDK